VLTNNHGDVVGTTPVSGTSLSASRAYDPWGTQTASSGSLPARGFQGDWTNPATGRVDMNARQYTPASGAFTTRDSIEDPAMGNRYGYTASSPLIHADPTGHLDPGSPPPNVWTDLAELGAKIGSGLASAATSPFAVAGGVFVGASVAFNMDAVVGGPGFHECGTACWEELNSENRRLEARARSSAPSTRPIPRPTPVVINDCKFWGSCPSLPPCKGCNPGGNPNPIRKPDAPRPPPLCLTPQCYFTKFANRFKANGEPSSSDWSLDASLIERLIGALPIFGTGRTAAELSGDQGPNDPELRTDAVEQGGAQSPPAEASPEPGGRGAGKGGGDRCGKGKAVAPYEVGTFDDLKKRSQPGDGLDVHHVPQGHPAEQTIPGYDYRTGMAIAIPFREHNRIPNLKGDYLGTPGDLVELDIGNLRDYTKTPDSALEELRNRIRSTYDC
jgi:RHS repeat-associated protein